MTKTMKWDAAEYLESDEDIEAFFAEAALESPEYLIHCLGITAKAKGDSIPLLKVYNLYPSTIRIDSG